MSVAQSGKEYLFSSEKKCFGTQRSSKIPFKCYILIYSTVLF